MTSNKIIMFSNLQGMLEGGGLDKKKVGEESKMAAGFVLLLTMLASVVAGYEWDSHGYVLYCPCMGECIIASGRKLH